MTEILFNNMVWYWMGIALISFIALQFIDAPYGRHVSNKWGMLIPNKLGWIIMELPALLLCPIIYMLGGNINASASFFVLLWLIHYVHRTLIFPVKTKTRNKQMPLAIALMAIVFNGGNGLLNGYWFAYFSDYPADYLLSPRVILGVCLFFIGMFINMKSDYYLISLRKPGETAYKIPRGRLFKYISCPNHMGEAIEWLGFAIAVNSLPGWSFFVWSLANLIPRALSHHRWYKSHFTHYPKHRKAFIPGII